MLWMIAVYVTLLWMNECDLIDYFDFYCKSEPIELITSAQRYSKIVWDFIHRIYGMQTDVLPLDNLLIKQTSIVRLKIVTIDKLI